MDIRKILSFLTNYQQLAYFYQMTNDGYLVRNGWIRSLSERKPVDQQGEPLPWLTIPFIRFLDARLDAKMRLLEFGSGNSTLYFSKRVSAVVSIESDESWYAHVRECIDEDVVSLHLVERTEYAAFPATMGSLFSIILVDGHDRFECASSSLSLLTSDGVLVLDNSIRIEYEPIYRLMKENGFRCIDFFGMAPGSRKDNCTTVFYRDGNCLGI